MALNEIARHFYEKDFDRLLGLKDEKIIKEKFLDMRSQIDDLYEELGEKARRIADLESELEVSKNLLETSTRNKRIVEEKIKFVNLFGDCDEEPLPFSYDEYKDALFEELEDLRERYQQDCITINQLQTTIDTLVDRYAKLREMKGL